MASSYSHSDKKCRMLDNITVVGYLGRQMSCLMVSSPSSILKDHPVYHSEFLLAPEALGVHIGKNADVNKRTSVIRTINPVARVEWM
ncbi:hypothetical protein SLA2020_021360 [Shorea laevis]